MDEAQTDADAGLDYVQTAAWSGLMEFLLGQDDVRAQFERETGVPTFRPPTGIEKLIDEASGYDPATTYIARFLLWATPMHWGDTTVITPSIQAALDRAHIQTGG